MERNMKWTAKVLADGFWWSGIEISGTWRPLYRVGRVGNCLRF